MVNGYIYIQLFSKAPNDGFAAHSPVHVHTLMAEYQVDHQEQFGQEEVSIVNPVISG